MCRVDNADGDGRWLTEPGPRKARTGHRCGDCGRTIAAGETYTSGSWVSSEFEGVLGMKMCEHCVAAGRWLRVVCGGHFWPGVIEELEEHWDEEPDLRSVGLGRLLILGRRRGWDRQTMTVRHNEWRNRRGDLVQIEAVNRWVDEALARVPESAKHW